jgi:hypothetical protein
MLPDSLKAMILLAALSQKWEMLILIVITSNDLEDFNFSDACKTILAQWETEQAHSNKGKQLQAANKLSAVKWKHGNSQFQQ